MAHNTFRKIDLHNESTDRNDKIARLPRNGKDKWRFDRQSVRHQKKITVKLYHKEC